MSTHFDTSAYEAAGFTVEEIARIKCSIGQADAGILIPAEEVWENLRKNRSMYV